MSILLNIKNMKLYSCLDHVFVDIPFADLHKQSCDSNFRSKVLYNIPRFHREQKGPHIGLCHKRKHTKEKYNVVKQTMWISTHAPFVQMNLSNVRVLLRT